MNIGILYCGYNQLNNVKNTLNFWNDLKIEGINFVVSVVSVPFLEYKDIKIFEDGTIDYIKNLKHDNVKNIMTEPKFVKERVARSLCMDFLLKNNLDILWQVDSDEYYNESNVKNIINFLKNNNGYTYSINFKNYIFDGKHYLDDFCVPKINYCKNLNILSFFDDNQVVYEKFGIVKPVPIPKEIALIKHLTWLNENGKSKVEYQLRHFGACSYKWNESKQQLELDFDYYRRHGYKVPTILKED
ncbi:MAG: hypothetical protein RLZ10_2569 [Bacteroidota bacterium]|jgi:hypothetical protein